MRLEEVERSESSDQNGVLGISYSKMSTTALFLVSYGKLRPEKETETANALWPRGQMTKAIYNLFMKEFICLIKYILHAAAQRAESAWAIQVRATFFWALANGIS